MQIEGVPEGYELVRIGKPSNGELFIEGNRVIAAHDCCDYLCGLPTVRRIEPTCAERQAAWVKENDVKVGDKVRVLRKWGPSESELHWNPEMFETVGQVHTVKWIDPNWIVTNKVWSYPYFVLEKVVPATRPMTRDEFLAAWKQRGFCPLVRIDGSLDTVAFVDAESDDVAQVKLNRCRWQSYRELASDYTFATDNSPLTVTE